MKQRALWGMLLIVAFVIAILYISGTGCPILKYTGIPCLGCGMTRACRSLVQLDFAAAWQYHPMIYLMPFCIAALLTVKKMPKRLVKSLLILVLALFILAYLMRLLDPANEVIKWHPENGEFYKRIRWLWQK